MKKHQNFLCTRLKEGSFKITVFIFALGNFYYKHIIINNIYIYPLSAPIQDSKKTHTHLLVFTSASDCRANEDSDDFQCKLTFSPYQGWENAGIYEFMESIYVMKSKCLFQDISRSEEYVHTK